LQELGSFFSKLHNILPSQIAPPSAHQYKHLLPYLPDWEQWLTGLSDPLAAARRGGFLCDPWEIAGLKRDEVRNSRVLAWLLAPRESHGFGDLLLSSLLAELGRRSTSLELPKIPDDGCCVRIESSPLGDGRNRLDIEIDAPNLYLIIEVKIDAVEGTNQLLRYGSLGEDRASNRPWGIVFLTPKGNKSSTANIYMDKVIHLSWRDLSSVLSRSLRVQSSPGMQVRSHEKLTQLLAKRFLQHVRNF